MTIKYYKYSTPLDLVCNDIYGKVWIYKAMFHQRINNQYKILLLLFNRTAGKWDRLCAVDYISKHLKLLNKKELFLEML